MNDYQDNLIADFYKFRPPYHPGFIAKLVNEVNLQKTGVPLDLLCGRGEIAKHLSMHCDAVVAVDGSKQMLDRAERNQKIKFLLGDVNQPNFIDLFGDLKFNHCFVGRAIHWIEDEYLAKIKESIFTDATWFVTMQGGYAKNNPWLNSYNEIIRRYSNLQSEKKIDWVSRKKILSTGFHYWKELSSNFSMKIDINFLYGTALSYTLQAHNLKTSESEIKASLRDALNPYIDDNGFLIAKISNSAFIYKA